MEIFISKIVSVVESCEAAHASYALCSLRVTWQNITWTQTLT